MQEKTAHSYMPLIICSIASFITPFMGSAVNIALPVIGDGLKANAVILGWVAMSYNLAAAMFLLPLGRLADLKGREILFRIGLGVFGLCSLGCALAWDPYSLVVFRFFQGLGGALLFGTSNAILSAYYPKEVRGKMLGICVSALYLGMALGPTIGGFMTSAFGWRALFGFVPC